MCGICGVYDYTEKPVQRDDIRRMCQAIFHRGPDEEGTLVEGNVGLGIRRLSIIDLETGRQPISNEREDIWIVFNGEIYNYPALREELEGKGHIFRTRSDTETIVHAYEEYGDDCVNRFNGMFGFAIWDKSQDKILLARDRLGKKPLYYLWDGKRLLFASEIKSILQYPGVKRELDLYALDLYLSLEYVPSPLSIFKGIRKLPPGHILILKNKQMTIKPYWKVPLQEIENRSEDWYILRLYELLEDAVKIRLRSDVPLGAFLSGGIDSSTTVAFMSRLLDGPLKTFSIGFDDRSYNELEYARKVADYYETEHHEQVIQSEVVSLTESLVGFLDEPLSDFSIFPTYLVSRHARTHVKVVLSGDGGDELFAGYETYIADRMARLYNNLPKFIQRPLTEIADMLPPTPKKKGWINKAKRFLEGTSLPPQLQHTRWMIFLSQVEKQSLYNGNLTDLLYHENTYNFLTGYFKEARSSSPLWQQQYVDIKTYLVDDILVKVDRMSMANSLEVRSPLLDYRLVEFVATVPSDLMIRRGKGKYIFKKIVSGLLPQEVIHRSKEGFSIPMKNWLRNELKPLLLDILNEDTIKRQGYFRWDTINHMIQEHLEGEENHSHRLWSLLLFQLWHKKYID